MNTLYFRRYAQGCCAEIKIGNAIWSSNWKTKAMKKIICLIAMALFTVTGCTSVEMNQTKTDTPDDNTQGNATTLSCADYTLNPLWNWAETPANQLIVIRSQAELADFIFPNDKLPEDIDFEKNTLLLVAGPVSYTHLDVYKRQGSVACRGKP